MSVRSARPGSRLIWLLVLAAIGLALVPARAQAAFPGRNGKIAYELVRFSGRGIESEDIAVMDADGGNATQLTVSDDGFSEFPTWSPDGTQIAFSRLVNFGIPQQLWVMGADGGNQHQIRTGVASVVPAWSPDGTKIAFAGLVGNFWDVFTVGVDGTRVTNLTNTPSGTEFWPAWSPDGQTIAFQRNDASIWVMNADGKNQRRTTSRAGAVPSP